LTVFVPPGVHFRLQHGELREREHTLLAQRSEWQQVTGAAAVLEACYGSCQVSGVGLLQWRRCCVDGNMSYE